MRTFDEAVLQAYAGNSGLNSRGRNPSAYMVELSAVFQSERMSGYVYAIDEGEDGGHIKIGYTEHADVGRRVGTLKIGNWRRLRTLGYWPGSMRIEKLIHRQLGRHHVSGEWFTAEGVAGVVLLANQHGLRVAMETLGPTPCG